MSAEPVTATGAFADIYQPHARAPQPCNACGEPMDDNERVDLRVQASSQPKTRKGKKHLASAGSLFCPACARRLYLEIAPRLKRRDA